MPIYEYQCQDCQAEFELMRPIKDADTGVICIHCHGDHIFRKISLFNASSGGQSLTSSSGCNGCTSNNCSTCGTR